jgi:hypothetical protein
VQLAFDRNPSNQLSPLIDRAPAPSMKKLLFAAVCALLLLLSGMFVLLVLATNFSHAYCSEFLEL